MTAHLISTMHFLRAVQDHLTDECKLREEYPAQRFLEDNPRFVHSLALDLEIDWADNTSSMPFVTRDQLASAIRDERRAMRRCPFCAGTGRTLSVLAHLVLFSGTQCGECGGTGRKPLRQRLS